MANSRQKLECLLEELINCPVRQTEISQKINDSFSQEKAVLVLDMSGFCRTARNHSIVLVLSMIYQMQKLLKPCIENHSGQLIKAEADNLFCIFDTVADALQSCRNIRECLDNNCLSLPEDCRLDVSVGIGFGHILNIENKDIFGDEVNLASKLGEDIAMAGEVLLTEKAFAKLAESELLFQKKLIGISGISINYYHFNFTN
ncbi:MAG: adenylate/guanylate cyclase domain-containing protein [Pyrinomonadaceae bacterium]